MIDSRLSEKLGDAGLDRLSPILKKDALPAIRIAIGDSPSD